jgi:hypothetical protein
MKPCLDPAPWLGLGLQTDAKHVRRPDWLREISPCPSLPPPIMDRCQFHNSVLWMKRAIGLKQPGKPTSDPASKKDPELDPLRSREEFKKLAKEME